MLKAAVSDLCIGNYLVFDSQSVAPDADEAGHPRGFPFATLEDLRLRNRSQVTLPLDGICPGASIVSHAEIERAFDVPAPTEPASLEWRWEGFYRAFPGAWGRVRLSVPGYSKSGSTAVVYLETGRGALSGWGGYLLLQRKSGGWVVTKRENLWAA